MSEINNISLIKQDSRIHALKNKKESLESGKEFENQLLETVNKLKSLDSEVDAMMEAASPKSVQNHDFAGKKIKHGDIAAENFTAANKTSAKSAKYVASQYEQSKLNKS